MWCLSRWLFLNNAPKLGQYLLLISAVTVGRVLFSEADHELLTTKLVNLLTWDNSTDLLLASVVAGVSKLDLARIIFAGAVLMMEPLQTLFGNPNKRYKALRMPFFLPFAIGDCVIFRWGSKQCRIWSQVKICIASSTRSRQF